MMRIPPGAAPALRAFAVLAALAALARPAAAEAIRGSSLALLLVEPGDVPRVVVLQRAITREWGPADDSTYHEVVIPDWKSEGWAATFSAAVPGAGQFYNGENSGWLYALAEAAGWTARYLFRSRADDLEKDVVAFAGSPWDSASAWSFQRWSAATGQDPSGIAAIYEADREGFYLRIADDPAYGDGWKGATDDTRVNFKVIRDRRERFLLRARGTSTFLWINHVVSALDALRIARNHNRTLGPDVRLRVGTRWDAGRPALRAALERTF